MGGNGISPWRAVAMDEGVVTNDQMFLPTSPVSGQCYAQIGGLLVATFVTLLLVPVLYAAVVLKSL